MCLGVPGKILSIDGNLATVDFFGVRRQVRLDLVDFPVAVGDYILNHVGYAIHRIPDEEIEHTVALFDELLGAGAGDLVANEVRAGIPTEPEAPASAGAGAPVAGQGGGDGRR